MSLPYMDVRPASEFKELLGETDFYTTTLFPDKDSWREGRKGHIGASDAFKILNTEMRRDLFREMRGEKAHEDLSENLLVQRGVEAEPLVRRLMAVENEGWDFYDGSNLLFVSKRKPFASCSLDCIAVNRTTGELCDIELKECPWSNKWKGDYAPDNYFTQVCHQHFVTGFAFCVLHPRIYLTHENGFTTSFERSYEWDMNAPEIASQVEALMEAEEEFWNELQAGVYKPRLVLPSVF